MLSQPGERDRGEAVLVLARRVYTLDATRPYATAILIQRGRVAVVGTGRALSVARSRASRVIDLGDAIVTPGLVDCHTHFFYWSLQRALVIDVRPARSREAALELLRRGAKSRRVGEWVLGWGFQASVWDTGLPTAADLDGALPGVPVLVRSNDGHTGWLSSEALRRFGITRETPAPPGGSYDRDTHGNLTGILREAAILHLADPLVEFARRTDALATRTVDRALADAYDAARRCGLVSIHSMDDGVSFGHLLRHRQAGLLGLRVVHAIPLAELDAALRLGLRSGLGDSWFRVGGVKIFSDGSLGSQTAVMFDAYPGRPGYCGQSVVWGDELRDRFRQLAAGGFAAWVHAIGDRAVHEVASLLASRSAAAGRHWPRPAMPDRIEHTQCIRARDARRMARAGIVASVQPCHMLGDIEIVGRHWPRAQRDAYPLRRLLDAGVVLAGGSDVPVESIDPRRSLYAAAVRISEAGEPPGGWYPDQRLHAGETLLAFTRGAAHASGGLNGPGALCPGAPADLTVWDENPVTAEPEALLTLPIRGVFIDGEPYLAGP